MSSALCSARISCRRWKLRRYCWRRASFVWIEVGKFGIIWSSSKFNNIVAFEKRFLVPIDSKIHWPKNAKFPSAFGEWWKWIEAKWILENWKRLLQIRNDFNSQITNDLLQLKWGASSRWSFGPNSAGGSIETTSIGKTHPILFWWIHDSPS